MGVATRYSPGAGLLPAAQSVGCGVFIFPMREGLSLRLLLKPLAIAAVVLLAGCQTTQIASQRPATKPAEPPPPAAAPPPAVQRIEPAAPAAEALTQKPFKVALLVPMSGQAAGLGEAMFNAAQLALFDTSDKGFVLQPIDTKGTPQGAIDAARQAVQAGASLVLGPIFSPEVKAAGQVTRAANIPMVAFTTDVTAAGDGVHALGVLPRSQVARVVALARQRGMSRFALLAPDNDYGRTVGAAYREVVQAAGGSLLREEYYTDPIEAAKRLSGDTAAGPLAVMIADEGQRLRTAAQAVSSLGGRVQLLGTALWNNDPGLGSEPALVGGWFPAPPQAEHNEFVADYQKNFSAKPPAIASLAYDATALAAVVAQRAATTPAVTALDDPNGFAGVDGIFRLLPDGGNQRGLAVWEVKADGARQIAPAPKSFDASVM